MKKLITILTGLVFFVALTGLAFSQVKGTPEPAKPAAPAESPKPAEVAKPAEAKPEAVKPEGAKEEVKKEAPPKPVSFRMGGVVSTVNVGAKKLTITQNQVKKERKLTLTVAQKAAKDLPGIKAGDAVNVLVTGNTITSLTKVF